LEAIRRLGAAGVPTGVMVAPVIPALTDHEIEAILEAARDAGATHAAWIMLRLPREVRDLFAEWLAEETPDRARRILHRIEAVRGGRLNDPRFGARMRGDGLFAELVARRFRLAVQRLGLVTRPPTLDCTRFTVAPKSPQQLDLNL
ncbi:MAG: radical SAM protein, partial [Alphaproteobacteria bacterium]